MHSDSDNLVLACDLGGTKLATAIFDTNLNRTDYQTITIGHLEYDLQIEQLIKVISSYKDKYPQLKQVGVSCAGIVDHQAGTVTYDKVNLNIDESTYHYKTVLLADLIHKQTGLEAHLDNDGNTAVIAEWKAGAGKGKSYVACLTLGTYLGSGIVLNNELIRTRVNNIFIGGIKISPTGVYSAEGIGHRASGEGPVRIAKEWIKDHPDSSLSEVVNSKDFSGYKLAELARKKDKDALEIYKQVGFWIGIATASTINMCAPEIVTYSGGFVNVMDIWFPETQRVIDLYTHATNNPKTIVSKSQFEGDASLAGAAVIALNM